MHYAFSMVVMGSLHPGLLKVWKASHAPARPLSEHKVPRESLSVTVSEHNNHCWDCDRVTASHVSTTSFSHSLTVLRV